MAEQDEIDRTVGGGPDAVLLAALASWRKSVVDFLVAVTGSAAPERASFEELQAQLADLASCSSYSEMFETAAEVVHRRRHRLGWGSMCGSCRELAAEVLAVGVARRLRGDR